MQHPQNVITNDWKFCNLCINSLVAPSSKAKVVVGMWYLPNLFLFEIWWSNLCYFYGKISAPSEIFLESCCFVNFYVNFVTVCKSVVTFYVNFVTLCPSVYTKSTAYINIPTYLMWSCSVFILTNDRIQNMDPSSLSVLHSLPRTQNISRSRWKTVT